MKQKKSFYQTEYSKANGFILSPSGTPPNMVELYCLAYMEDNKKRLPEMDGYYYRHELRRVNPQPNPLHPYLNKGK
jgi:hypothetical protein